MSSSSLHEVISKDAVCIIPNRLYWLHAINVPASPSVCLINVDSRLTYSSYHRDFGPLDLSLTYRYLALILSLLRNPYIRSERIIHWSNGSPEKCANAAYLMASFCIMILEWEPQKIVSLFSNVVLKPFRDASKGPSNFPLTLDDCCTALYKAKQLGWFDYHTFDLTSYEHYEKLPNGNLQWIIPKKFIAFSTPSDYAHQNYRLSAQAYVPILKALDINLIIRLNKKHYDERVFEASGIHHTDLYFPDGSCPTKKIIKRFLEISESFPGQIGVHCKAGLGRTGTLLGCYAIKNYGFTAKSWIAWNRICRPGSVLGVQQEFLCQYERTLQRTRKFNIYTPQLSASRLLNIISELSLEERKHLSTIRLSGKQVIEIKIEAVRSTEESNFHEKVKNEMDYTPEKKLIKEKSFFTRKGIDIWRRLFNI